MKNLHKKLALMALLSSQMIMPREYHDPFAIIDATKGHNNSSIVRTTTEEEHNEFGYLVKTTVGYDKDENTVSVSTTKSSLPDFQYLYKKHSPFQLNTDIATIIQPAKIIGIAAVAAYVGMTYLIQEDFLVKAKYPHAQAWYDAMTIKYPIAHLDTKQFLQKFKGLSTKNTILSSTFNQIYFPQNDLIRINSLYGMQMNNQTLSADDELFLAKQEFLLLREAGHIEHNDLTTGIACTAGLFTMLAATTNERSPLALNSDVVIPSDALTIINKNLSPSISSKSFPYISLKNPATTIASCIALGLCLGHYQERNADRFAYENGDDKALLGGISFFEGKDVDPLFNIENKKQSPYVKVDSTIGTITQSIVSTCEIPYFYLDKGVKMIINSTSLTRWLYDAYNNPAKPGAPSRAAAIREEMQRRSEGGSK